jgi:hypothetical protein
MTSFGGKHLGHRKPDALRRASNQSRLVFQLKFHTKSPGRKSDIQI